MIGPAQNSPDESHVDLPYRQSKSSAFRGVGSKTGLDGSINCVRTRQSDARRDMDRVFVNHFEVRIRLTRRVHEIVGIFVQKYFKSTRRYRPGVR